MKLIYFTRWILWAILIICFTYSSNSQELPSDIFAGLEYRNVGPTRGGRVTTVASHPSHPSTHYFGATGGGVWKSQNYGYTWKNISDGFFASASIGAIAIAPTDPDIIYVGTGSDGIRSNVILGKGIYKSSDAGETWDTLGLEKVGQIGSVIVHPQDPKVAYVAAIGNPFCKSEDRGLYHTTDGGISWKKVYHHSDSVGVVDLEFAPDDPNTIYAALWRAERKPWTIISGAHQVGGLLKSTDGGKSWSQLQSGLPQGLIGKSDLAVCATAPDYLYALIEAPQGEGGLFISKDRGISFELVSTKKELLDRPFYYCNVDVNPQNPASIYINSTRFWHSSDAGKTWSSKSTPHGDNHDMWIHPEDTLLWIQGNDGGANVTRDGGKTWSSILNQPTAELYQVNVDDQFPYYLYAGQQDNSTIAVPSEPPHPAPGGPASYWLSIGGCETGPVVPKPGNPDIVYANCKGRFGVYNKKTGQEKQYYVGATNIYGHHPNDLKFRFQRVAPIHVSPHDPNLVYHASQYLHKTVDDGVNWEIISPDLTAFTPETQMISGSPITRDVTGEEYFSTIYAVQESPLQKGVIWVGSNDGLIHLTKDGGKNWQNVTPTDLPPLGRVQHLEASPHKPGKAIAAIYRYLLGDFKPYLYLTQDFGQTWQRIADGTNGIQIDEPTRVVREDPDTEGLLYAGTEYGVYFSTNNGQHWRPFSQNLPVVPITDMKIAHGDLIISTMGRSFWILDQVGTVNQAMLTSRKNQNILFKSDTATLTRYRSRTSVPQYPVPSVIIDYFLSETPSGEVQIAIYQGDRLVRSFNSEVEDEAKNKEADMSTGFGYQAPAVKIEKEVGGHRVRWDLRHQGHQSASGKSVPGPLVAPGSYRIELIANHEKIINDVFVRLDPRLQDEVSIDALLAQEKLALSVRDAYREALLLRDYIDKKKNQATEEQPLADKLIRVREQLVTSKGRYQTPQLIDQLQYLYSMITRALQQPGQDAHDRYLDLLKKLKGLQALAEYDTSADE